MFCADVKATAGNVATIGSRTEPIGKSMDSPPESTVACAPHFYPDHMREARRELMFADTDQQAKTRWGV
jgi:hypothetical protein